MTTFLKPLRRSQFERGDEIDVQASTAKLTDLLTEAVNRAYPGSAIIVAALEEQDDVIILTADGTIGGISAKIDSGERERIEEDINRLATPIFDSYAWIVFDDAT